MKYYSYPYYDPDPAKQVIKTLSEQEILEIYWDWWKEEGIKRWGKEHFEANYSKKDCIEDWVVVNWAWESNNMGRNLMNELTEGIAALAMAHQADQAADKIESLQKQLDESITMAEMLAATINQYKQLDDEQRATIKKLQNELDIHNARVHNLSLEEWRRFDQS